MSQNITLSVIRRRLEKNPKLNSEDCLILASELYDDLKPLLNLDYENGEVYFNSVGI